MATKRLLLYATDTYKLSSLLLRRVVLTQPPTLTAYREKTRQLLLDQSRVSSLSSSSSSANVAAVKLLEWDREWNIVQYYGVNEYAKRWWSSQSWSLSFSSSSSISSSSSTGGTKISSGDQTQQGGEETNEKKNVARVAFMITSSQRHQLSTTLGYTSQDIRTLKPIEALLLLENGVKKEMDGVEEYDFRVKLNELLEENGRLLEMQNQKEIQQHQEQQSEQVDVGTSAKPNEGESTVNDRQSVLPEEAQQIHAKPDVAMALLSVDKSDANEQGGEVVIDSGVEKDDDVDSSTARDDCKDSSIPTPSSIENIDKQISNAMCAPSSATPSQPALVSVTSHDAEELHMTPDVAKAILTSQQQKPQPQEQEIVDGQDKSQEIDDNGPCWYEVIERFSDANQSLGSDANSGERVIALFPTKKEALDCVRIKQSFRKGGDDEGGDSNDRFFVRRRWNA